jgi:hypothetical protein
MSYAPATSNPPLSSLVGNAFPLDSQLLVICSFQLILLEVTGGNGTLSVNPVGDGCSWTASSNADWVKIQDSGAASQAVAFLVAPNTGPSPRTATLQAGNNLIQLVQKGNNSLAAFGDVNSGNPDTQYIVLVTTAGLMTACTADATSFCPGDFITRA